MGKKFLSILGTSKYSQCEYYIENEKANTTSYVQEALIELLCKNWSEKDTAIIFLTDSARRLNWENTEDETRRLKDNLLKKKFNLQILDRDIKDGKNIDEIWDIFDVIMDNIDDGDEVIFDITHSFRSIPMLALVILNYAKVIKNIKIKGIYYGAYDPSDYNNGIKEFPIIDLTSLDEILEWSQAINSFTRYGNSEHIKSLSKNILLDKLKSKDESAKEIDRLVKSLNDFTSSIDTSRGRFINNKKQSDNRNSIQRAYLNVQENINEVIENQNQSIKPLVPLFSKVQERIVDFKGESNLATGIAVINWSIENNMIQQGYTALEETINTFVCLKYGLDETNKDDRDDIVSKALTLKSRNTPENEWIVKEKDKQKIKDLIETLDDNIYKLSDKVKKYRNDINHFGFSEERARGYDVLANNLIIFRDEFLELIKK